MAALLHARRCFLGEDDWGGNSAIGLIGRGDQRRRPDTMSWRFFSQSLVVSGIRAMRVVVDAHPISDKFAGTRENEAPSGHVRFFPSDHLSLRHMIRLYIACGASAVAKQ